MRRAHRGDAAAYRSAVPIEGLYKDELALQDKVQIQELIKKRIPTGDYEYLYHVHAVKIDPNLVFIWKSNRVWQATTGPRCRLQQPQNSSGFCKRSTR